MIGSIHANKLVVTSTADNETSPTNGMLRYFVNIATNSDTITFNVKKVTLVATISIKKGVNIDGSGMGSVNIDGNKVCQVFNIAVSFDLVYLKGLNIINGYNNKTDKAFGGGMALNAGFVNAFIENCTFQDNEVVADGTADGKGGAVYSRGGEYRNCFFLNNKVTGTSATNSTGGVFGSEDTFINCVFSGNSAKKDGALLENSKSKVYNCTFFDNKVTENGVAGAMILLSSEVVNCIFHNNTQAGGSINNVLFSVGTTVSFCAMESTNKQVGLNDNIGLTASPFKGGTGNDKFRLAANSPCINKGTDVGIEVLEKDIVGKKRIFDGAIDMGAFEYSSSVNNKEVLVDTDFQISPNPTSSNLLISGLNDIVNTSVFDSTGRLVLETNDTNNSVNISALENGIFVLKVKTKFGIATRLFIKY